MEEFLDELKEVEKHSEYKEWRKENSLFYLVHGFLLIDKDQDQDWQIGYYSRTRDRIITLSLNSSNLSISPESEVFKKEGAINKLEIDKIIIGKKKAFEIAEELRKKDFPAHLSIKTIMVIQNLEGINQWNITFIASSMNILNLKLDSRTGELIKSELIPFKDICKNDKGEKISKNL